MKLGAAESDVACTLVADRSTRVMASPLPPSYVMLKASGILFANCWHAVRGDVTCSCQGVAAPLIPSEKISQLTALLWHGKRMRAYSCRVETGIILTCHFSTFWPYNVMWLSRVASNHESTGLKRYFHNGISLIKKNRRGKEDSSGGMIREEFPSASSLVLLLSSCICFISSRYFFIERFQMPFKLTGI